MVDMACFHFMYVTYLSLNSGAVFHGGFWRYMKSGDETSILPTEVAGVCEVGSIESLEV
jgi:hypothetical protein